MTTVTSWIGFDRRSALLAPLVPGGVAERAAVEEVLGRPGLAAVDAGVELASAEHRVAVRGHGEVARLHQQHRLGQADVAGGDDREVLVVLLVHAVADVGPRDLHARPADFDRLGEGADLQHDVVADVSPAAEHDPRGHRLLEPGEVDRHGVAAQHQRSASCRLPRSWSPGWSRRRWPRSGRRAAPGTAEPWSSVTTPPIVARSERWARSGLLRNRIEPRAAIRARAVTTWTLRHVHPPTGVVFQVAHISRPRPQGQTPQPRHNFLNDRVR